MRKKIRFIPLIMVFVLMFGCATVRKDIIAFSKEDIKNAETAKKVAINLLKTWPINSGFIRGSLGNKMDNFPFYALQGMDELDKLAAKKEWTDQELGYSLGIRIRMLTDMVLEVIKEYAPSLLTYLPMAF